MDNRAKIISKRKNILGLRIYIYVCLMDSKAKILSKAHCFGVQLLSSSKVFAAPVCLFKHAHTHTHTHV